MRGASVGVVWAEDALLVGEEAFEEVDGGLDLADEVQDPSILQPDLIVEEPSQLL